MRIIKLPHSYNNLLKLQPYKLKFIDFSKLRLQNFSCSSYLAGNKNESGVMQLSVSGVEQLMALPSFSKKNNQLSQVEEKDIETVKELKKGNSYYPYKSPEERAKKIMAEEVKINFRKAFKVFTGVQLGKLEQTFFDRHTDILIIGGGAVGLSIAFALRNKFPFGPKVTVIDKDSCFPHASTNLSQGIVTQQLFSDEEEISILKYGAEFFSAFSRNTEIVGDVVFNLPYDPLGTLVLADSNNAEEVIKRNEIMKFNGINNKILDQKTLKRKFPWLSTEDVLFGSLGMSNEGVIDPWAYLFGLKGKAINLGVQFVTGEVIDFGCGDSDIRRVICKLPDGMYDSIDFCYCVLAGGLETLNLVKELNKLDEFEICLRLPLEERMRYEYCFYSPDGPGLNTPILISPDGTYFRRAGLTGHYVAGVPSVANAEENDPYHVFKNHIQPFLMKRIPGLHKVDLARGWVDAYDFCTSNSVGITGPHPDSARIIFALGFSHLGLQYLPALARAVMEFIYYDNYQTIDFTSFHIENLWKKQHLEAEKRKKELLISKERIALNG